MEELCIPWQDFESFRYWGSDAICECWVIFRQVRVAADLARRKKPDITLKHIRPPPKIVYVPIPNPDELDERGATPDFNYKVREFWIEWKWQHKLILVCATLCKAD